MREQLSNLGAKLGNWNDRAHPYDMRSEQSRRHRVIDRIASWLHRSRKEQH